MSALKVLVTAVAVSGLFITQSVALTIQNKDPSARMVFVSKSSVPADVEAQTYDDEILISGRKSAKNSCLEGCTIRLANAGKSLSVKGNATVLIQNGKLKQVNN